jgi:hypothetical protein
LSTEIVEIYRIPPMYDVASQTVSFSHQRAGLVSAMLRQQAACLKPAAARRLRMAIAISLLFGFLVRLACAESQPISTVRVGYQKYGTLNVVKAEGSFENAGGKRDKSQLVSVYCRPPVDGGTECRKHRFRQRRGSLESGE